MVKKLDKPVKEAKEEIEKVKKGMKRIKKEGMDPNHEKILIRMASMIETLEGKVNALERSYLKTVKRVYLNPYYHQISGTKSSGQKSIMLPEGLYLYQKSAVHPFTNSLFI